MNYLWDNLYSSKKERNAYLCLLTLLIFILGIKVFLSHWYTSSVGSSTNALAQIAFADFEEIRAENQMIRDSVYKAKYAHKTYKKKNKKKRSKRYKEHSSQSEIRPFFFDPNTVSDDSLHLLGFSKFAVSNLRKYLNAGGRIHSSEKLETIYGVRGEIYNKVKDYVKIVPIRSVASTIREKLDSTSVDIPKKEWTKKSWSPIYVNINTADTTELKKVRGIGSYYSKMIVKRREALGGFFSKEQIAESWFMRDSIYNRIKDYLIVDVDDIEKKNINDMDKADLASHPYIGLKRARTIHNYRKKHQLTNVEDLYKMRAFKDDYVDTLKMYFIVQ